MIEKNIYVEHCGTLSNLLTVKETAKTEQIVVSGNVNQKDIETLRDMVINNSLTHINLHNAKMGVINNAFSFQDDKQLQSIIFPYNLTEIGDKSFQASGLSYIYLPDHIISIGIEAFKNTQLRNLYIPQSTKTIKKGAFTNTPLEYVYLNNVERIDSKAFSECNMLKEIRCHQSQPPRIALDTFSNIKQCLLIVPKDSKEIYEHTHGWSAFTNIVEENLNEFSFEVQEPTSSNKINNSNNKIGCGLLTFIFLLIFICIVFFIANTFIP